MQRETEHQTSGTVQEKKCNMAAVKIKDNTGGVKDISFKKHNRSLHEYSLSLSF